MLILCSRQRAFVAALLAAILLTAACQPPAPTALIQPRLASPIPSPDLSSPTPLPESILPSVAVRSQFDQIQSDRLIFIISTLVSAGSRHALSAQRDASRGIFAARAALLAQFNAVKKANPGLPLDVWTQPVSIELNGYRATTDNIVAVLQGTTLDAGVVVLMAHYDSINTTDILSTQLPAPGANVNGSGVAILFEALSILAHTPHRATVIFLALTASETGRQGSDTFIRDYLQAQQPPIRPRAVINLDTLGANRKASGEEGPYAIRIFSADPNESPSRQLARWFRLLVSAYPEIPQLELQSAGERFGRSGDHQVFSVGGMAAVGLVEPFEDLTRARTARDTLDGIRTPYLVDVTKTVLALMASLADGLNPPGGIGKLRGSTVPTLTWRPVAGAAGYVLAVRTTPSIAFEQSFIVDAGAQFGWAGLSRYAYGVLATIDQNGIVGLPSPEFALQDLEAR